MKERLLKLLWELEKEKYPDYNKKADEILNLFNVSNCECKKLPKGEIAISSRALTDPNWKG